MDLLEFLKNEDAVFSAGCLIFVIGFVIVGAIRAMKGRD